ncbi:hypothetical protein ACJJTC_000328 [Scirpophaga incertulas]
MNGSISELRYTPASERDYGALSCRGSNAVGRQEQACVFQIVPAARPSPPRNCTVSSTSNISNWIEENIPDEVADSLVVRCVTGYDGGLPQLVVLEALDSITGKLKFNVTANETDGVALFMVPSGVLWSSGNSLRLIVHSRNDKGASERIIVHALAYQDPERRTDGSSHLMAGISKAAFWAIVLTIAVGASAAILTGYFLKRKRSRPPIKQPTSELQLNAGDSQYVVAYTLKPPKQAQPDILNPPPDGRPPARSVDAVKNGPLGTEWCGSEHDSMHSHSCDEQAASEKLLSPRTSMASKPVTSGNVTLSRREHLIAEEIPGPESCV